LQRKKAACVTGICKRITSLSSSELSGAIKRFVDKNYAVKPPNETASFLSEVLKQLKDLLIQTML
jgi:hypothetical protein